MHFKYKYDAIVDELNFDLYQFYISTESKLLSLFCPS